MYGLRRQFGDTIFVGTNPVALAAGAIESDVARFQSAIDRDELDAAVSCYNGPFLDGFFLPDAQEFEHWSGGVRARLATATPFG